VNSSLARRFNGCSLCAKLCCLIPVCVLLAVIIVIVVLLIYLNVGVYAASTAAQSQLTALQSNSVAGLTYGMQGSTYMISPQNATSGIVIVPEFKTDPVAYIPLAVSIASSGYSVAVVSPTLHFPPFATGSIDSVVKGSPTNFVIGGLGTGADTASSYVSSTGNSNVQGLFMMAPFSGAQAPSSSIQTTVVYGDDDGWVSTSQIMKIRSSFPGNANFTLITGANHAQFGSFASGFSGDMTPNISASAQQQQTVAAAVTLLQSIK